jgi:hypothetical protein
MRTFELARGRPVSGGVTITARVTRRAAVARVTRRAAVARASPTSHAGSASRTPGLATVWAPAQIAALTTDIPIDDLDGTAARHRDEADETREPRVAER